MLGFDFTTYLHICQLSLAVNPTVQINIGEIFVIYPDLPPEKESSFMLDMLDWKIREGAIDEMNTWLGQARFIWCAAEVEKLKQLCSVVLDNDKYC